MQTRISSKGYVVPKSILFSDPKIKSELTVRPYSEQPRPTKKFIVYRYGQKYAYLPPYYGVTKFGPPTIPCETNAPIWSKKIKFKGSLRDKQKEPVRCVLRDLMKPPNGAILSLNAGSGKTVLALYIASILRYRTAVVVNDSGLAQQWAERISQFVPRARIGIVQGAKFKVDDADIVIIMIQTLSQRKFTPEELSTLQSAFGFVIWDECHHVLAETFHKALLRCGAKYRLGLSATPYRSDKLQYVIRWFIGPISYRNHTEDRPAEVRRIYWNGDSNMRVYTTRGRGPDLHKIMDDMLCNDRRNGALCNDVVIPSLRKGRCIIMLCDRREHCEQVYNMLVSQARLLGSWDVRTYYGNMPFSKVVGADVLVATYRKCAEAFDYSDLNTCVLVSPIKAGGEDKPPKWADIWEWHKWLDEDEIEAGRYVRINQICGRILRKDTGHMPIIYDVVDSLWCYRKWTSGRVEYYRKCNWPMSTYRTYYDGVCATHTDDSSSESYDDDTMEPVCGASWVGAISDDDV